MKKSTTLIYGSPACGYCGEGSRTQFVLGKGGKNPRYQKSRLRVCRNGHKFMHKR